MITRLLLALALLLLPATDLYAWGRDGHAIVAQIAADHLTPAAHAEIQRLLSLEPGATLESIASWADEHRNPTTGKWHYVNFPRGSDFHYTPEQCPGGDQCLARRAFTRPARSESNTCGCGAPWSSSAWDRPGCAWPPSSTASWAKG